jgi:outer membrane biosynthesis protein TonB
MTRKVEDAAECGRAFAQCSAELRSPAWLVTLGAFGVHALLVGAALLVSSPSPSQASKSPAREYLDVELPPPPAAVAPAPEPVAPEPEPIKAAPTRIKAPTPPPPVEPEKPTETPEPEPPAPAAAQAGQALTATDTAPNAPADTLVTGDGAGYAGGTTERGGTSKQAVAATTARAYGVEGGTGTAVPDRSRAPQLASGLRWDCPTPEEALEEGVEHATVGLMVEIDVDGKVLGIEIKDDPGYGFAREAKSCAMRKRWVSALDRAGQPKRAKQLVNVRF